MKIFFKIFCGIVAMCVHLASVQAQSGISGVIKEKGTGKPLSKVSIYLPELHVGVESGDSGGYHLTGMASGTFNIQFSYLGFKTVIKSITIGSTPITLNVEMENTGIEAEEIVIYGTRNSDPDRTPVNVNTISQSEAREKGSYSISDALSKMPGMSKLSTGVGISKPVIRGLYGNRVQSVLMGIRFDNQQWQDEHGLGLNDIGVDKIEVIKGASSLLYGSEALGGVLNIIEEKPAATGTIAGDVSIRGFSNTLGGSLDGGIKGANEKFNWRIRVGAESQGDYSDGNGDRAFNSRFDGYVGKGTIGFGNTHWISTNNYMFSLNHFGFVMDSGVTRIDTNQSKFSRDFSGPHHTVYFNILTSQNTFFKGKSKIKVNVGAQLNTRLEQEGGNRISLNMNLGTYDATLQWVRTVSDKTEFTLGGQQMVQTNRNHGSRVIVPDANFFESGVYGYLKESFKRFTIESGLRFDLKNITAMNTKNFTFGSEVITPLKNNFKTANGSLGAAFNVSEHFTIKANASSGYRAPNLAELFSNGMHEGTYRYEIGDADMKTEQDINGEVSAIYETKSVVVNVSGYRNQFFNYIYLNPTDEEYFGPRIYRYVQKDAFIQGGETSIDVSGGENIPLDLSASYSIIRAETTDGENLPFIPSDRIQAELKLNVMGHKHHAEDFIKAGVEYNFDQDHQGQFETATPAYTLVDVGGGAVLHFNKQTIEASVVCNNLLNEAYFDALSRFKEFAILNQGRNVNLNIKIPF